MERSPTLVCSGQGVENLARSFLSAYPTTLPGRCLAQCISDCMGACMGCSWWVAAVCGRLSVGQDASSVMSGAPTFGGAQEDFYEISSSEVGRPAADCTAVLHVRLQHKHEQNGRNTHRNTHHAHRHISPVVFCWDDQRHDSWYGSDYAAI